MWGSLEKMTVPPLGDDGTRNWLCNEKPRFRLQLALPGRGCPPCVHRRPIHTSKTGKITTESNCGSGESQGQNVKDSGFLLGESQAEPGPGAPAAFRQSVGQSSPGWLWAAGSPARGGPRLGTQAQFLGSREAGHWLRPAL